MSDLIDARDVPDAIRVGSPLRDASVNPRPGDYLAPTNAGTANPHGPAVMAPELGESPRSPRQAEEAGRW